MGEDSPLILNALAAYQSLLRERLHYFLHSLPSFLLADVMRALSEPGKLYSQHDLHSVLAGNGVPAGLWSLRTFLIIQCISSEMNSLVASSVAVSIECLTCAVDLLDDVEDEDKTTVVRDLGIARVLNVSTTLLMLAQRAITSLSQHGVVSEVIIRLLHEIEEVALVAAIGQHQDLLAEQASIEDMTYEKCLEIAEQKSSSLVSLPFRLGSLCAGLADKEYQNFVELGRLLGIAEQLDNDCNDLYFFLENVQGSLIFSETETDVGRFKTDIIRKKKTLPLVLAALAEKQMQSDNARKAEIHLSALHEGMLTTCGISLLYRERAHDCLQEIEIRYPFSPALRFLLRL